jgi:carboxymethylenebutenolidase
MEMTEKEVEIRMPDGTADGVLFQPEGDKKLPGVMHLPDIGGVRPAHREMAKRLAGEGYVVLLPNVFYRAGKSPVWEFPFKMGEERTMKRMGELASSLPPDNIVKDISAYVEFLEAQKSVSPALMGAVGYCFTGAMALRAAAARPEKIGAAASFHGGALFTDKPSSPHTVLPEVKARLYFGHAEGDPYMDQEAIAKLDAALAAWSTTSGGKYESEVYIGAHHGWTVPDSPVYNKPEAERAYGKLRELFKVALR